MEQAKESLSHGDAARRGGRPPPPPPPPPPRRGRNGELRGHARGVAKIEAGRIVVGTPR